MQTVKNETQKPHINDNLVQSRPKMDIKLPIKLDLQRTMWLYGD